MTHTTEVVFFII